MNNILTDYICWILTSRIVELSNIIIILLLLLLLLLLLFIIIIIIIIIIITILPYFIDTNDWDCSISSNIDSSHVKIKERYTFSFVFDPVPLEFFVIGSCSSWKFGTEEYCVGDL